MMGPLGPGEPREGPWPLMKGVEGTPRAELCLEASANLPVSSLSGGRGCRNEMRTDNEAKQKRSSRGPT